MAGNWAAWVGSSVWWQAWEGGVAGSLGGHGQVRYWGMGAHNNMETTPEPTVG